MTTSTDVLMAETVDEFATKYRQLAAEGHTDGEGSSEWRWAIAQWLVERWFAIDNPDAPDGAREDQFVDEIRAVLEYVQFDESVQS